MKKIILIASFFFFLTFTYSQEKGKGTTLHFEEGVFKNSIIVNTKLSNKWSFENKLQVTYTNFFNQIEVPVTLKFNATNKLSFFAGSKLNYIMATDTYNVVPYTSFSIMAQAGTRYDFSKNFFGEIKYEYDLMNTKNNYNINSKSGGLKFGGRLKF